MNIARAGYNKCRAEPDQEIAAFPGGAGIGGFSYEHNFESGVANGTEAAD